MNEKKRLDFHTLLIRTVHEQVSQKVVSEVSLIQSTAKLFQEEVKCSPIEFYFFSKIDTEAVLALNGERFINIASKFRSQNYVSNVGELITTENETHQAILFHKNSSPYAIAVFDPLGCDRENLVRLSSVYSEILSFAIQSIDSVQIERLQKEYLNSDVSTGSGNFWSTVCHEFLMVCNQWNTNSKLTFSEFSVYGVLAGGQHAQILSSPQQRSAGRIFRINGSIHELMTGHQNKFVNVRSDNQQLSILLGKADLNEAILSELYYAYTYNGKRRLIFQSNGVVSDKPSFLVEQKIQEFVERMADIFQNWRLKTEKKSSDETALRYVIAKMLNRISSVFGHKIKNDLAVMNSTTNILAKRLGSTLEKDTIHLIEILKSTNINFDKSISEYFESWPEVVNFREYEIDEVIQEAIISISKQFGGRHIEVEFTTTPDRRSVLSTGLITEHIYNILDNSRQAIVAKIDENSELNGSIQISVIEEPGTGALDSAQLIISISDNGGGVPPDHLNRVGDQGFTTKQTGSGIGLFAAKQYFQSVGGHLATNNIPNGFQVLITVPALEPMEVIMANSNSKE